MNEITYGISEEKYTLGKESRTSYGIVAFADAETNGTASIVASVNDITDDSIKPSELVERYNKCGLILEPLILEYHKNSHRRFEHKFRNALSRGGYDLFRV